MGNTDDFQRFCQIVAALRAEDGCSWDRAQTHESLKTSLFDETAEVAAAVNILRDTGDGQNLCEELGDLLLQIILQSQIAEEEGIFTIEDVLKGICEKMIYRHPHVFKNTTGKAMTPEPGAWDRLKGEEKKRYTESEREAQKKAVALAEGEIREHFMKIP